MNFIGLIIHFWCRYGARPVGLSAIEGNADIEGRTDWPLRTVLRQKVKLCDDGHIAFAQSSLVLQIEGKGTAMRRALPIVIVAVLLTATVVDVVAAGIKTVAARRHFYYATPVGINVAVPSGMKSFPTELLPQ
jgi:hypothetical protein